MRRKFRGDQWVVVETIGGKRYAKTVDGNVTRIGRRIKIRMGYGPAPITGWSFGAPRAFHVDDVRPTRAPIGKRWRQ